jgi:hypothetical protein
VLEVLQRIARWKWKPQWIFDLRAKSFRKLEITFDRMGATIYARNMIIGEPRTLTSVTHSKYFTCAADARDEGTAQQSLKIEGDIGFQLPRFFYPAQQIRRNAKSAAQLVPREKVNVIDIAIAA